MPQWAWSTRCHRWPQTPEKSGFRQLRSSFRYVWSAAWLQGKSEEEEKSASMYPSIRAKMLSRTKVSCPLWRNARSQGLETGARADPLIESSWVEGFSTNHQYRPLTCDHDSFVRTPNLCWSVRAPTKASSVWLSLTRIHFQALPSMKEPADTVFACEASSTSVSQACDAAATLATVKCL